MTIASIGFLALPQTRNYLKVLSMPQLWRLVLIGMIICIHWLCFYQSIKEFNSSSIALICLGTGPMFVVWIEFFTRQKKELSAQSILISIIAMFGMYFIANGSKTEAFDINHFGSFEWAIIYGVLASFLAASFTIMNSNMTSEIQPEVISFVEMLSGAIYLFLFHFVYSSFDFLLEMKAMDTVYILILSIVCTNIPFLLSIYSLKKLEPFIVTLTVNLEPIYGLIFAAILFGEYKNFNFNFYLGSILILFSVFLPLIFDQWEKRRQ